MKGIISTTVCAVSIAGLVYEAIDARKADPFYLSWKSFIMIIVFSVSIFLANLSRFQVSKLNTDQFDFDEHSIGASRSFVLAKDRSELLLKVFKVKSLDVLPPRSN